MASEVERKFLVDRLPNGLDLGQGVALRQGYLAEEAGVEVRVRLQADGASLTVKAGSGLVRDEVEIPLDGPTADALWTLTQHRIEKRRHVVAIGGGATAEIDVYEGALAGLLVAEVEVADADAAAALMPPSWFGRELTGDRRWSNASLARHGHPDG